MNRKQAAALVSGETRLSGLEDIGAGWYQFNLARETTRGFYRPEFWFVGPAIDEDGEEIPGTRVAHATFLAATIQGFQEAMARVVAESELVGMGIPAPEWTNVFLD